MYFSRVRIRPSIFKSSQLAKVLEGNIYGIHRLLWDLFPEQQQRTFLYREEIAREQLGALSTVRGEAIYYLVSKTKPIENELFSVDFRGYQPQLEIGQHLTFECRVNPVVTRLGKKHDVVMDAQQQFLKLLVKELNLLDSLPDKPEKSAYKKLLLDKGGDVFIQRLKDRLQVDPFYAERLRQTFQNADLLEWAIKADVDRALRGRLPEPS